VDRIDAIVATVLKIPVSSVTEETSPDTIDKWDSLAHLNLVMAIEIEFQISLSPEDAMEMLSVGLIRTILKERGVDIAQGEGNQ
jgi:acyl carrier protein